MTTTDPSAIARALLQARHARQPAPRTWRLADVPAAYAVQDATAEALGPIAAWKVGAASPEATPGCAPLPASGVRPAGALLQGSEWQLRGIEAELAVRLGRDLTPDDENDRPRLSAAIDAALPALEVVETRLQDWRSSDPLDQLADLQSHGALIVGPPLPWRAEAPVDLRTLRVTLAFDGQPVADARGSHPVGNVLPLLGWLARHARQRGRRLRAGDVVTTGSCTGLLFAWEGAHVQATVEGVGTVDLRF
ncbi:2-keto-4-pentenoate hydratase [Ramlibacter sp. MMS24-I3-19]|uniref:2-keto-4-pentenoate hydratase n=1 Tax=Ramlibacter sp. MMS24-I3-19 TaxID=3416606 RepID=UPI003D029FC7